MVIRRGGRRRIVKKTRKHRRNQIRGTAAATTTTFAAALGPASSDRVPVVVWCTHMALCYVVVIHASAGKRILNTVNGEIVLKNSRRLELSILKISRTEGGDEVRAVWTQGSLQVGLSPCPKS